jgi:hypothetical protein
MSEGEVVSKIREEKRNRGKNWNLKGREGRKQLRRLKRFVNLDLECKVQ